MTIRSSILTVEGEAIENNDQASTAFAELRDVVEKELHDSFFGAMSESGKPVPVWLIAETVAHAAKMAVLRTFLDGDYDERTRRQPELLPPIFAGIDPTQRAVLDLNFTYPPDVALPQRLEEHATLDATVTVAASRAAFNAYWSGLSPSRVAAHVATVVEAKTIELLEGDPSV